MAIVLDSVRLLTTEEMCVVVEILDNKEAENAESRALYDRIDVSVSYNMLRQPSKVELCLLNRAKSHSGCLVISFTNHLTITLARGAATLSN